MYLRGVDNRRDWGTENLPRAAMIEGVNRLALSSRRCTIPLSLRYHTHDPEYSGSAAPMYINIMQYLTFSFPLWFPADGLALTFSSRKEQI